jgi:hypothetical protein
MKILIVLAAKPGVTPEQMQANLVPENKLVWEMYTSSLIREMYFRTDTIGAVFILEADNVSTAEQAFNALPMVKQSLITAQFIPLAPFTNLQFAFSS